MRGVDAHDGYAVRSTIPEFDHPLKNLLFHTFGILMLTGIAAGCQRQSTTLEFVVPDNFTGVLKLRANSKSGVKLISTNQWTVLAFPASGILEVQGTLPTLEWHTPIARFTDGTRIPIPGPAATVPDSAVALRSLGIKKNGTESWYLVGRDDQMQQAMNAFYGFEMPKR